MRGPSLIDVLLLDLLDFCILAGLAIGVSLSMNQVRSHPLAWILPPAEMAEVKEMDLEELKQTMLQPGVMIVDVRPAAFYELGHIAGAVNLPLPDLKEGVALPPAPEAHLVVYCADVSCPAARSAALLLRARGFHQVSLFSGGWTAWKRAGLAMEAGL